MPVGLDNGNAQEFVQVDNGNRAQVAANENAVSAPVRTVEGGDVMRIAADTERRQIREPIAYRLSDSKVCDQTTYRARARSSRHSDQERPRSQKQQ
jgi:hypothetical protein